MPPRTRARGRTATTPSAFALANPNWLAQLPGVLQVAVFSSCHTKDLGLCLLLVML